MTNLDHNDLRFAVLRLPPVLRDYAKDSKAVSFVIAGGYLRSVVAGEPVNDVDLFVASGADALRLALDLLRRDSSKPGALDKELIGKIYETGNALTIHVNRQTVQIIRRWVFEKPEQVVESFDFSVCQAAIWYDRVKGCWRSLAGDHFYVDLAAKRLRYLSPVREEEPGGSMLRVLKYYQRGYRIPLDSLGAIIARLGRGVFYSQEGNEGGVAQLITGLLRQVDPLIDPTREAHLPATTVESAQLKT